MATSSTEEENSTTPEYVDVLIVGAGLSGIGAACHLETGAPGTSYAILEARHASGGTWDLFKYPGIRSDSDMFTLAYEFRPWKEANSIADGDDILRYIRETAQAYDVDKHIELATRVVRADWSTADARWTVTVEDAESGKRSTRSCSFLYLCSGYFQYEQGYTPNWPGLESYTGRLVHPQHWPQDLELTDKRVIVIGSGATAVTLVPALVDKGARVTMVQRSPSFVMALPAMDPIAGLLRKLLPERRAYAATRWKNVRIATALYGLCRRYPAKARAILRKGVMKSLPAGYDVDRHFKPSYEPWDQRMCLVPEGDFFSAIRSGGAEVVTDHVESFTESGLRLRSGAALDADVVVTATGLNLLPLGGIELMIDGQIVRVPEHVAYKGMMLDGVPNFAFALGYTNAAWTLKVDLVSSYLARLLGYLSANDYVTVTPRLPSEPMVTSPLIEMSSGYFERSRESLPLQGDRAPWRLRQHYAKDAVLFRGPIEAEGLEFGRAPASLFPNPLKIST